MFLSDEQLLLLDCFMYSDIAVKHGNKNKSVADILKAYTDSSGKITPEALKKAGVKFSGDMNANKLADVMNRMTKDPRISSLKLTHTTKEYKGSIRAACFYDPETGKATVAFRGTGGSTQQWHNNFEGYGEVSTETQRDAADFINSLPYDNIEVTGHSNGANAAMFVTIVCGEKIAECRCYEGQGFSDEFRETYQDEIRENGGKITCISASNDPVHAALPGVDGATYEYVNGADGTLSHGGYALLENNEFGADGNFAEGTYCEEEDYITGLRENIAALAALSVTPFIGPVLEFVADTSGSLVGMIIDFNFLDFESWLVAYREQAQSLLNLISELGKDIYGAVENIVRSFEGLVNKIKEWKFRHSKGYAQANAHPDIVINTGTMTQYAGRLKTLSQRAKTLDRQMNGYYWQLPIEWNATRAVLNLGRFLRANALLDYAGRLDKCAGCLKETAAEFNELEKELSKM